MSLWRRELIPAVVLVVVAAHVDHIMFLTPGRQQLTALLVDTLGLLLVWPQPGSAWTGTSGVGFGNTTLEIGGRDDIPRARLSSLAFQAVDFHELPAALERRGVYHGDSVPGPVAPDKPEEGPRWQIIGLAGLGRGAFFIRYRFDMDERRERFRRQLEMSGGGVLGVRRVREVFAGANTTDSTMRLWENLLGEAAVGSQPSWLVADMRVRIVPNDDPRADEVVVEVRSLELAERALASLGISARRQERALGGSGAPTRPAARIGAVGVYPGAVSPRAWWSRTNRQL